MLVAHSDGRHKNIFAALYTIDKDVCCHTCGNRMRVIKVISKIINDVFGNENFGYWMCSVHNNQRFYPNPLRAAATNRSAAACGPLVVDYMNIVNNKFPWKCLYCGKELIYKDERHKNSIC
jgi:hypothetical protein